MHQTGMNITLRTSSMIEKAIIQRTIKKNADGDFSTFMSKSTSTKDVVRVLNYAAKKANEDQKKVIDSVNK